MANPFYEDQAWSKLVSVLKHMCNKANEAQAQRADFDLTDIAESVLGIRIYPEVPGQDAKLDLNKQRLDTEKMDQLRRQLIDCLSDTLALTEVVRECGQWVAVELEQEHFMLIRIDGLTKIVL